MSDTDPRRQAGSGVVGRRGTPTTWCPATTRWRPPRHGC